jgi:predicted nucleotidyltransferase
MNDPIAQYFSRRIKEKIGNHAEEIILFGSRARGDAQTGSDYDFLVVLDDKNSERVSDIRGIEVEVLDKFDVLAGCVVWSREEWNRKKRFPIGRNITTEGVAL